MPNTDSDRLTRLERKVDWIIRLVALQFALTFLIALSYGFSSLLRLVGTVFVLLVVAVPLLYVFRNSLPTTARSTGKRVGNLIATSFRWIRTAWQR